MGRKNNNDRPFPIQCSSSQMEYRDTRSGGLFQGANSRFEGILVIRQLHVDVQPIKKRDQNTQAKLLFHQQNIFPGKRSWSHIEIIMKSKHGHHRRIIIEKSQGMRCTCFVLVRREDLQHKFQSPTTNHCSEFQPLGEALNLNQKCGEPVFGGFKSCRKYQSVQRDIFFDG